MRAQDRGATRHGRDRMDHELHHATFIVRVSWAGRSVAGVVERVRTGAKIPFRDADGAGPILARMIAADMGETEGAKLCNESREGTR